jgi:hypothetical protein
MLNNNLLHNFLFNFNIITIHLNMHTGAVEAVVAW